MMKMAKKFRVLGGNWLLLGGNWLDLRVPWERELLIAASE